MKTTQVLLRENVKDLGRCGDIVQVAQGYARNFLVPKRIAVEASEENVRAMQRRRLRLDADAAAHAADVQTRVEALSKVSVTTKEKADEGGSLYGSVNAGAIAALLRAAGHPIEDKDVRLAEPIKSVGTHAVPVHVFGDEMAEVSVVVEAAS